MDPHGENGANAPRPVMQDQPDVQGNDPDPRSLPEKQQSNKEVGGRGGSPKEAYDYHAPASIAVDFCEPRGRLREHFTNSKLPL